MLSSMLLAKLNSSRCGIPTAETTYRLSAVLVSECCVPQVNIAEGGILLERGCCVLVGDTPGGDHLYESPQLGIMPECLRDVGHDGVSEFIACESIELSLRQGQEAHQSDAYCSAAKIRRRLLRG